MSRLYKISFEEIDEKVISSNNSTFNKLVAYWEKKDPEVAKNLNGPATDEEIKEAEKKLGMKLPADLIDVLKTHNGQPPAYKYYPLFTNHHLLSLDEMVDAYDNKIQQSDDEVDEKYTFEKGIKSLNPKRKWIIFTEMFSSDKCFAVDLDPDVDGTRGQVIVLNAGDKNDEDGYNYKIVASSFKHWFEEYAKDAMTGRESALEELKEDFDLDHQRLVLEIDRQGELIEGLEALRMIAERIGTPSPTQVALFRVAANMTVIGTEKRAQDFLPAMESNKPIALESFTDKIKEIIKAIIEMIKKIYNKTKQFILNLFKSKEAREKESEKAIKRLKETKPEEKHNKSRTVSLTSDLELDKTSDSIKMRKHGLEHAIRYLVSKEIISNRKLTINDVHNVCITKTKLNNFIKVFTDNFIKDFMKFYNRLENIDLSRLRLYYNSDIHKAELEQLDNDLNIHEIHMSFVRLENDFNRQFGDTQLGQIVSLKCDKTKINFDIHSSELMGDNTGIDGVDITFDNFDKIKTLYEKSEFHNLPLSDINELNDKLIVFNWVFEMKTGDKNIELQNSLIVKKIKEAMVFIQNVSLLNSNVLKYNNFVLAGITNIVYAAEREYQRD